MPHEGRELSRILVVDTVRENRLALVHALSASGMRCVEAADDVSAWRQFTTEKPDLILAAFRIPGFPVLDLVNRVRDVSSTPFVVQVRAGELAAAVAAIRNGASDVIPLPCDVADLPIRLRAAITQGTDVVPAGGTLCSFAGQSPASMRIREQITALAGLRIPVLFRGEKGSGRDHAARCLAQLDGTDQNGLLTLGQPPSGIRARYDSSKTIYLDEIERHSRMDQAYWTERIIESERATANAPRRIFASTSHDLEILSRRNEIDSKLAKLLLRFVVDLPPLRERPEDLVPLAQRLSAQTARRIGRRNITFTTSALDLLQEQVWPGNVTQLAELIEKLVAFSPDGMITRRMVLSLLSESPASVVFLRQGTLRRQRDELVAILEATGGNLAEAARRMNMSRGAVIYRAQKFGLLAKRNRPGS